MAFGQSWVVRRLTKWKAPTKLLVAGLVAGVGGLTYISVCQDPYRFHLYASVFDNKPEPTNKTPNFYYSICGIKNGEEQSDSYALFPDIKLSNSSPLRISLFGIFDGDGCAKASKYASQNLPIIFGTSLKQRLKDLSGENASTELVEAISPTITSACKETFAQLKAKGMTNTQETANAILCVFGEGNLWTAAVGEFSFAVLSRSHRTTVIPEGSSSPTWDEPDITRIPFTNKDEFLILGSRGLWGYTDPSDAVALVHTLRYLNPYTKAANLAQALVYNATQFNRERNITACVFLFEHEKEEMKNITDTSVVTEKE